MTARIHHAELKIFFGLYSCVVHWLLHGKSLANMGCIYCVLIRGLCPLHSRVFRYIVIHVHTCCACVFIHCVCVDESLDYCP